MRTSMLVAGAAAMLAASIAAPASAAVLSGSYDLTVSVTDSFGTVFSDGPTAGTIDTFLFGSFDDFGYSALFASTGILTMDIFFGNASAFDYDAEIEFEFTNVVLEEDGAPVPILSVVASAANTNVGEFDAANQFFGPTIAFGSDSITVGYGFTGPELAADGPTVGVEVSTVPVPGAVWLLASGIGALVVARRRAAGRTANEQAP